MINPAFPRMPLPPSDVTAYYNSALTALRYLEGHKPTGRRFGPDADARWSSFRGDLTTADRIDLMIRDANAQWPRAFGARTVFATRAVPEDEAFGASWEPLDAVDAEELWRAADKSEPPSAPADVLQAAAKSWGIDLVAHEVGEIGAADRIVVAGPSAIAATMATFERGSDLDWSAQVTVVATPPGHRQLAALACAMLNMQQNPTRILTASAAAKPIAGARLLLSDDATPEDAARAKELASA